MSADNGPTRVATGLSADSERRLLVWIAERLPAWVSPDHLTALGFGAQLLAGLCYRLAALDPLFLHAVNACLLVNWFGDSLDGTLARVRRRERPRYGFYLDHLLDAVGIAALCAGAAGSDLVTPALAAVALVAYLLFSVHIALAAAANGVFRIAYAGVGGTELRVLLAAANLAALVLPRLTVGAAVVRSLDLVAVACVATLSSLLFVEGWRTARELERADRARLAARALPSP
jgi:phosphatidylglycerophosphate synthase